MKLLGYKTLRRTNATTSSRERWIRAYVSSHNMLVKNLCIKLHLLASTVKAHKIILLMFRVVRKESLNIYTRIGVKLDLKIDFCKSR